MILTNHQLVSSYWPSVSMINPLILTISKHWINPVLMFVHSLAIMEWLASYNLTIPLTMPLSWLHWFWDHILQPIHAGESLLSRPMISDYTHSNGGLSGYYRLTPHHQTPVPIYRRGSQQQASPVVLSLLSLIICMAKKPQDDCVACEFHWV